MKKRLIMTLLVVAILIVGLFAVVGTASAAETISVTSKALESGNSDEQTFTVTNNSTTESADLQVSAGTGSLQGGGANFPSLQAGKSMNVTVKYALTSGRARITVMAAFENGAVDSVPATHTGQFRARVSHKVNGEVKDTEYVTVGYSENKTVSAKTSFVLGGVEYTVQGGSNQTVNVSTRDVTFNYVEKQYTPDTVGVNLLNANGKTAIATKVSTSLTKEAGSWVYTAPAEITYNGARYERIGGGAITHTYANGTTKDYDVFYNKITENPAKPYTITIRYEDANGAYLTQDAVVVQPTGTTVQPTLKSELRSGGKTYKPQAGQSVTHKVSDGAKTYTVVCNEVESQAYSITVVYRNSVTAERIGSATVTVNPGSTVNITSPSTYGEYTKVAGQADQGHRYGDTLTTYTYYYSPRGVESEVVTVYFVDANTDRVLNTATAVASAGNPATIAKLQFEGFELASWETTEDVVHEYGAAKKFYRVYYIAEGEEEPVEPPVEPVTPPVVVPEDIVEPVAPVEEEPTAPVDEEIPTPVTPIGPGENEGNEGEEETITDPETPLGPGGSTKIDPLWALALIPAIALIVFLIVVKKKSAEENK